MILTTLEQEIDQHQDDLTTIREELRRTRASLVALRARLEEANGAETSLQPAEVKKITGLVTACLETENRLEKCKAERSGIAQCGVAFDLDAARDAIGCKLDHLRACYCAEDVSE